MFYYQIIEHENSFTFLQTCLRSHHLMTFPNNWNFQWKFLMSLWNNKIIGFSNQSEGNKCFSYFLDSTFSHSFWLFFIQHYFSFWLFHSTLLGHSFLFSYFLFSSNSTISYHLALFHSTLICPHFISFLRRMTLFFFFFPTI